MFALVIRTCAWDEIPLGDNVEMGTCRSLAGALSDAGSGWRESWLPAPSRESKEEELPFQVLCSYCLMFTGVLVSSWSLSPAFGFWRGWSCVWDVIGNFASSFVVSALLCTLPEQWTQWTPVSLGLWSFPGAREGGLLHCWQTRMGSTNQNCLPICPGEKTLPKHMCGDWYQFCAVDRKSVV